MSGFVRRAVPAALAGWLAWIAPMGADQAAQTAPATRPGPTTAGSELPPLIDGQTGGPALEAVLRRLDDLFRSTSSKAQVELVVTRPRRKRTMGMTVWTRGTEKALIVIDKPQRDAGTATLKVGENLWNYLPRISRTIRIPPSMMLSAWMGSDLTNDDLVRRSSLVEDFAAKVLGRSGDPDGWWIELRAKEGVVGLWEKIEYLITPDASLPIQAKYYDRKGRLARTMDFREVKEFDGRRIPSHLILAPTDEEGHRTELFYHDVDFEADVPDSTFSLSRLERSR